MLELTLLSFQPRNIQMTIYRFLFKYASRLDSGPYTGDWALI